MNVFLLEKTNYDLDENDISAIIGYYRCGVKLEEIAAIISLRVVYIDLIVRNYFKYQKRTQ